MKIAGYKEFTDAERTRTVKKLEPLMTEALLKASELLIKGSRCADDELAKAEGYSLKIYALENTCRESANALIDESLTGGYSTNRGIGNWVIKGGSSLENKFRISLSNMPAGTVLGAFAKGMFDDSAITKKTTV